MYRLGRLENFEKMTLEHLSSASRQPVISLTSEHLAAISSLKWTFFKNQHFRSFMTGNVVGGVLIVYTRWNGVCNVAHLDVVSWVS